MKKRIVSILLVALLCVALLPLGALGDDEAPDEELSETLPQEEYDVPSLAETTVQESIAQESEPADIASDEGAAPTLETPGDEAPVEETEDANIMYASDYYINPLYADVIDESDLNSPSALRLDGAEGVTFAATVEEAAQQFVSQAQPYDCTVTVGYIYHGDWGYKGENVLPYGQAIADAARAVLFSHSGESTGGDYLRWRFSGWKNTASGSTYDNVEWNVTFTYELTYYTSAAQEAALTAKINEVMSSLGLDTKCPYEKLRAIYDYITGHVTYDHIHVDDKNYKLQYTAYAAMMNGTSVCQGYASLLYRMLLQAGIDCRLIAGKAGKKMENHAWNIVKLDGVYYAVDATWDEGKTNYNYFLKTGFDDHYRDAEFETAEFSASYPMTTADYTHLNDHTYTASVTAPTCTAQGYTTYTCSVDGFSYKDTYTDPTGVHTWGAWTVTKPASCTEGGTRTHTCSVCGVVQSEGIPATGHTWGPWTETKAAAPGVEGEQKRTCSVCGETETQTIPALPVVVIRGDVNGDGEVNAKDRMYLARHLAKWPGYETINEVNADVNGDGEVNAKDRMYLARCLAKWPGYVLN